MKRFRGFDTPIYEGQIKKNLIIAHNQEAGPAIKQERGEIRMAGLFLHSTVICNNLYLNLSGRVGHASPFGVV